MSKRRFEMYQYRQALLRMRLVPNGEADTVMRVSPTAPMEPFRDRRNGASR